MPNEPLTPQQMDTIGKIIIPAYVTQFGMQLRLANSPGEPGLGTHKMGGQAWGGHDCPGDIRTSQRQAILDLAASGGSAPKPTPEEDMNAKQEARLVRVQDDCDKMRYQLNSFVVPALKSLLAAANKPEPVETKPKA